MFVNSVSNLSKFIYKRIYKGPVQGVILDWSGTTIDKYVIAPAVVFVDVFDKYKVPITMQEARLPMGLRKDLHIKAITEIPEVRKRWIDVYDNEPQQKDVDNMFKDFVPMQMECLKKYTTLLPNTVETVNTLRNKFNIKIGSTTGFTKEMVDLIMQETYKQGYKPDVSVAGDEVKNGARPKPFMVFKNMDLMNVHPIQAVVKVDDTITGCQEGIEAGCWSVGIARWSNYMDIDNLDDGIKLTKKELDYKLDKSREILSKSGAHYVIDTLEELPNIIEDINLRLGRGENP